MFALKSVCLNVISCLCLLTIMPTMFINICDSPPPPPSPLHPSSSALPGRPNNSQGFDLHCRRAQSQLWRRPEEDPTPPPWAAPHINRTRRQRELQNSRIPDRFSARTPCPYKESTSEKADNQVGQLRGGHHSVWDRNMSITVT